ncbi:MAG TPA: GDSL-type esterase/lipase family protein [Chloroflexia bacterium]|nr:GDSL-type esterase/lipase family protein [Chloroflexia bacterium]
MSLPQSQPTPAAPPGPPRKSRGRVAGEGLAVLAITLLLVGGLLEGALRLFAPQIAAPITGLFVADPATAYRLQPGAQVVYRFAEGSPTFAVNAQGLREDHPIGPPATGTTRLLCLGDSFVFGMGVQADQALPHLLNGSTAADGSSVESLNAGVFGYGTDNEAAWLRTYGWPLQPKIVLVGFFVGNDVKDVMLGMGKTTVDAQGRLVATSTSQQALNSPGDPGDPGTAPASGGLKGWLEQNSHAYIFLRNLAYNILGRTTKVQKPTIFDAASFFLKSPSPAIDAGWDKTTGILDSMRADAQAHGAEFVVVVIPAREQVQDTYWAEMKQQFGLRDDQLQRDLPQQRLAAWSARTGTPLIDLFPGFQAAGKTQLLYFRTDRHWNAAGHALAAQLVHAGLVQRGWLK